MNSKQIELQNCKTLQDDNWKKLINWEITSDEFITLSDRIKKTIRDLIDNEWQQWIN